MTSCHWLAVFFPNVGLSWHGAYFFVQHCLHQCNLLSNLSLNLSLGFSTVMSWCTSCPLFWCELLPRAPGPGQRPSLNEYVFVIILSNYLTCNCSWYSNSGLCHVVFVICSGKDAIMEAPTRASSSCLFYAHSFFSPIIATFFHFISTTGPLLNWNGTEWADCCTE